MFYSIDRIEEEVAFCIGDYVVDEEEEMKRKSDNFALAESLFDE